MAEKKRTNRAGRSHKKLGEELRFKIDAYTPLTMPMARLAEYLTELAEVLGEPSAVHFLRVEAGSTCPIVKVDPEAVPKVRERTERVRAGEGTSNAMASFRKLNKLLREDDATAVLLRGRKTPVLRFPGREESAERFAAVREYGTLDGEVRWIGGIDETIHITLKSEDVTVSRIQTNKQMAKQLAPYLFELVRLVGQGKWRRDTEGEWQLEEFRVQGFEPLKDTPLSSALEKVRAVKTEWDEDSYAQLDEIRHGPKGGTNGGR